MVANDEFPYPLANCHIAMENPPFLMGKSYNKWQFSIAMLVYQRVPNKHTKGFGYPWFPYDS